VIRSAAKLNGLLASYMPHPTKRFHKNMSTVSRVFSKIGWIAPVSQW